MDAAVKSVLGLVGVKSTPLKRRFPVGKIARDAFLKDKNPINVQYIGANPHLAPSNVDGIAVTQSSDVKPDAIVCDTRNMRAIDDLTLLHTSLNKSAPNLAKNGRLIMISGENFDSESSNSIHSSTVASAVGGFTRSFAKEYGAKGITANMIRVSKGADQHGESGSLNFLLSKRSAFITGQTFNVTSSRHGQDGSDGLLMNNKRVVVTGASRGIGESTVRLLHAEGANILLVDHPSMTDGLQKLASSLKCGYLAVDVTDKDTPSKLVDSIGSTFGSANVDAVVHNAGITKDKSFKKMSEADFKNVIQVNLAAIARMDEKLVSSSSPVVGAGGRMVYLSSINGIAGAFGQTNYSCSKAGVIGYVRAMSNAFGSKGVGFNAVAPGFIETEMTKKIPFLTRNVARYVNSLVQEGYPLDVAELILFLTSQASSGLSGETIRVCGGNMVGQ